MSLNSTDIWVNQLRALQVPGARRGDALDPYILPDTPVVQPPGVHTQPKSLFSWPAWLQPTAAIDRIRRLQPSAPTAPNTGGGAMISGRGLLGSIHTMDLHKLPRELQRKLIEAEAQRNQEMLAQDAQATQQAQGQAQQAQGAFETAQQEPTPTMDPRAEFAGRMFGGISQALDPRMGGAQTAEGHIQQTNQDMKQKQLQRLTIMEAQASRLADRYEKLNQLESAHKWMTKAEEIASQRQEIETNAQWNDQDREAAERAHARELQARTYQDSQADRLEARREAATRFEHDKLGKQLELLGNALKSMQNNNGKVASGNSARYNALVKEYDNVFARLGQLTLHKSGASSQARQAWQRGIPLEHVLRFAETPEEEAQIRAVYSEARN